MTKRENEVKSKLKSNKSKNETFSSLTKSGNLKEEPYIECEKDYRQSELFTKDVTCIVYVDGCRFLPENTSYTKVSVSAILSSGDSMQYPVTAFSDLGKGTG